MTTLNQDAAAQATALSSERRVRVAVHNGHCHKYAICQQEAPEVFALRSPTRLTYDAAPPAEQTRRVLQAARLCPMQAITVDPR